MRIPYSPEGPAHPNEQCVFCSGVATTLTKHNHDGLASNTSYWVCQDRMLCLTTMVYEQLLRNIRSA